jgi:K+-sensing histidine kinase KdpD
MVTQTSLRVARRRDPWFVQHPVRAKMVVAASFVAVFVLHLWVGDADAAILYVLPVALAALAFGLLVGTVAGLVAVGLIVLNVVLTGESLPFIAWFSHAAPLLLLGLLAGASADRIRQARIAERYALEVALLQREAAEVNDSVVQGLAAARWLLESGQVDRALDVLDETAQSAQALVSRVLGANGVLADDVRMPQQVVRRHTSPSGGD